MRTPRQRGQNRRDHRTRPALLLALGPMVVAAPAAAAAVDAHAVDPAAPADSVLRPQLSAGPNGTFTIRVGPPGADVVAVPADPSGAPPTPTASAASPDSGPAVAGDTASPPSNATGAAATPTPTPGPYTVTVTPRPNGPVPSTFGSPELDAQLQQARAQITALLANALRAAIAARAFWSCASSSGEPKVLGTGPLGLGVTVNVYGPGVGVGVAAAPVALEGGEAV